VRAIVKTRRYAERLARVDEYFSHFRPRTDERKIAKANAYERAIQALDEEFSVEIDGGPA
jgi:hypothetical protein